eukprot:TRINITY_DN1355_c1_g1_i1.p1 TRINITY_DN1355_c1_g1~~TRINITY_DN1355_c1_g1_i1.p1  ORF type:complete len:330 (+),score=159.38 TRINITY_DN1355_c1_g1_i1:60-1049(+)
MPRWNRRNEDSGDEDEDYEEEDEECEEDEEDEEEEEEEDDYVPPNFPEIIMFSGCKDSQTSADVHDTSEFKLPEGTGQEGAGGACTHALLASTYKPNDATWMQLLRQMRTILRKKRYEQVPQLSTSRKVDLHNQFEICGALDGTHRALLIGINYVGHQQGRLSGCVNDVLGMMEYLEEVEGFDQEEMRVLIDDHDAEGVEDRVSCHLGRPTKGEIISGISWLVKGAEPGDCLFLHYSGHGGQVADDNGDESDGLDEVIFPEDFNKEGVIKDDDLHDILVKKIPKGVRLVCVMDCCHSASILDLPYMVKMDDKHMKGRCAMRRNPGFRRT